MACRALEVPFMLVGTLPHYPLPLSALRPELARIVAETFLSVGSWDLAKERILTTNALQVRTASSAIRLEREQRNRLSTLTRDQLDLLAHSHSEDRAAMAWLSIIKYSPFVFGFASEVLRAKLAAYDTGLRLSDYEDYSGLESVAHPALAALTDKSRAKLRQVLVRVLKEAGILGKGTDLGIVHRPVLSPAAVRAVSQDSPRWLAGFLVPDEEIGGR